MDEDLDPAEVAAALLAGVTLLVRRIRQTPAPGELTMPERAALAQLGRSGPSTSSALARELQVTAQSMGSTVAALRERGLIERRPDPDDGRRLVLSVSDAGHQALRNKRNARTELVAEALTSGTFSAQEMQQLASAATLLERLAQHI